ncbi:MAG TPA: SusC/RagA family TonB-linked outer membrane protein, partial [Flavitalea sp.]|nr:SusC/RagA family TonB-linked outer membrane protein [Flavitalea sp.]
LKNSSNSLNEVVVTALGVARDKRSLGYATQNLKGDELANRGEANVVNSLQGKVAGVSIVGASGSPGASTNINIRGISSFTGNNQPLFVIDGVPVSNDVDRSNGYSTTGSLADAQPSNRALDIDMNNIESMNILKGPAAAALYGSRASAGAIIITTKKGSGAKGRVDIILNSSYGLQRVSGAIKPQNGYGQGSNGVYSNTSASSWGPAFGAVPSIANGLVDSLTGNAIPYQLFEDNMIDFYRTGTLFDNSLTINSGDAKQNTSFSIGNLSQEGVQYGTDLDRTNVSFGLNSSITEKLKIGGKVTYTNTRTTGVLGGNQSNGSIQALARSVDINYFRDNYKNLDGSPNWVTQGSNSPYFVAFENPIKGTVSRVNGNVTAGYDLLPWLNVGYRLGLDLYTDKRKQIIALGNVGSNAGGQVREDVIMRNELNSDLMIMARKDNLFIKGLNINGLLGQNVNQRRFQSVTAQGDNLSIPGFYNLSNATAFQIGTGESNNVRRLVGYYGQASFAYNNYLFVEFTGRVDKSSTLPESSNTFFYPSFNAGFVFTDALLIKSNLLSYGKLRISSAKVGNDAGVNLLDNTYSSAGYGSNVSGFNFPYSSAGTTLSGFVPSSRIAPLQLTPEFTTANEIGVNLGLFNNKVSIDFSYFNTVSKNQILNVAIPNSTGYSSVTTNTGKMTNKGFELLVNITPISTRNFKWNISANFTRIRNKVISLSPGIDRFGIPGGSWSGTTPSIVVGQPYGVIVSNKFPRVTEDGAYKGQFLVDSLTGLFKTAISNQIISDPNADYKLGITNSFKYGNLNLSVLFDFSKGGQIISWTAVTAKSRGVMEETGADRDQPRILPGVVDQGKGNYRPNNIQISSQTYWATALGGLQNDMTVYDATVFRLRELTLGYDLPSELTKKAHISGIRLGLFGRNLFYVAPNSPIDPEVNTQGAGNIRGLELQGAPPAARTIGFNVRVSL